MNVKENSAQDTEQNFSPAGVAELDLYQKREKIYTRKIEGFFQRVRIIYRVALTAWVFPVALA